MEISQKSPLFLIIFFFYNSLSLKKLNLKANTHIAGFINNITILVMENTTKDNNINLLVIYKRIFRL